MKKLMGKIHSVVPARMTRAAFVVVSCMMVLAMSVFAEDPTPTQTISTAMSTAFQTMISDLMTLIATILPTALTVVGVMLLVGVGIRSFKKIVNKAS